MKSRGHDIFVAAREKEITYFLLDKYDIPYHRISSHQKTIIKKIVDYFIRWFRTFKLCERIKPDIAIGVGDFYLPQIGRLSGFPTIVITDTEQVKHDHFLTFPFATYILTPSCYKKNLKKKHIRYDSYNELAYLAPKYFTPDLKIYDLLGIKETQRFVIIRFISWTAVHDIGHKGLAPDIRKMAVKEFSKQARVFISSEQELPWDLKKYQLPVSPEKIHHALYYADLLYGESSTMASEAACLGTPAIYVDDRGRGYTDEQDKKYGLVFNFTGSLEDQKKSVQKGVELLAVPGIKSKWHKKRDRMLGDKIDLTGFLIGFIDDCLAPRLNKSIQMISMSRAKAQRR